MTACQERRIDGEVCGRPLAYRVLSPAPVREVCCYHKRGKIRTEPLEAPRKSVRCTDYDHLKLPRDPVVRHRQAIQWRTWRIENRRAAREAFLNWRRFKRENAFALQCARALPHARKG